MRTINDPYMPETTTGAFRPNVRTSRTHVHLRNVMPPLDHHYILLSFTHRSKLSQPSPLTSQDSSQDHINPLTHPLSNDSPSLSHFPTEAPAVALLPAHFSYVYHIPNRERIVCLKWARAPS